MYHARLWWPIAANLLLITTISAGIWSSWTVVRGSLLGLACAGAVIISVLSVIETIITDRTDWRRVDHATLRTQNTWLIDAYVSAVNGQIDAEDYWRAETDRLLIRAATCTCRTTHDREMEHA